MKIKIHLISISVVTILIFIALESKSLWTNASLFIMNMTHDNSWYDGDSTWVTRYNRAIWLSKNRQYQEAKSLIAPLLNDTNIPQKAEIAELYGDLIYSSGGSPEDTIRMYERSISFVSNERVEFKILSIKKIIHQKTGSGKVEKMNADTNREKMNADERAAKKEELQKIASQRSEYLGNGIISASQSRSTLERLIESVQSGTVDIAQDW